MRAPLQHDCCFVLRQDQTRIKKLNVMLAEKQSRGLGLGGASLCKLSISYPMCNWKNHTDRSYLSLGMPAPPIPFA